MHATMKTKLSASVPAMQRPGVLRSVAVVPPRTSGHMQVACSAVAVKLVADVADVAEPSATSQVPAAAAAPLVKAPAAQIATANLQHIFSTAPADYKVTIREVGRGLTVLTVDGLAAEVVGVEGEALLLANQLGRVARMPLDLAQPLLPGVAVEWRHDITALVEGDGVVMEVALPFPHARPHGRRAHAGGARRRQPDRGAARHPAGGRARGRLS